MSAGLQCDGIGCGRFSPDASGWYVLGQQQAVPSVMEALGIGCRHQEPATFCSLTCVANYAYVVAMASGEATGSEPPPRSGIGWPR